MKQSIAKQTHELIQRNCLSHQYWIERRSRQVKKTKWHEALYERAGRGKLLHHQFQAIFLLSLPQRLVFTIIVCFLCLNVLNSSLGSFRLCHRLCTCCLHDFHLCLCRFSLCRHLLLSHLVHKLHGLRKNLVWPALPYMNKQQAITISQRKAPTGGKYDHKTLSLACSYLVPGLSSSASRRTSLISSLIISSANL